MSKEIKIGHASLGEGGLVSGGQGGDQTGKEVYIINSYDVTKTGYTLLLRPKSASLAEKSAQACEAGCANSNIGYSQFGTTDRSTLYEAAKNVNFNLSQSVLTTACNTDCSAFMYVCALAGGAQIDCGTWGPNTSNMETKFTVSGEYEVKKDSIYFTSADYLKRGDILVKPGTHTIMILANGSKIPVSEVQTVSATDSFFVDSFFAIKISVSLSNINKTAVEASAELTKIENGEETALSDSNRINAYKWTYDLYSLNDSKMKVSSKKLHVNSKNTKFSLTGLKPNNSYLLKVTANEKASKAVFSSPDILFTTLSEPAANKASTTEFKGNSILAKQCKVFLAAKENFKRTIIYNRREET